MQLSSLTNNIALEKLGKNKAGKDLQVLPYKFTADRLKITTTGGESTVRFNIGNNDFHCTRIDIIGYTNKEGVIYDHANGLAQDRFQLQLTNGRSGHFMFASPVDIALFHPLRPCSNHDTAFTIDKNNEVVVQLRHNPILWTAGGSNINDSVQFGGDVYSEFQVIFSGYQIIGEIA